MGKNDVIMMSIRPCSNRSNKMENNELEALFKISNIKKAWNRLPE